MVKLTVAPGVTLWREKFPHSQQKALLDDVLQRLEEAPLYKPVMPGTANPSRRRESNFGRLGWVADKTGYRYPAHPSPDRRALARHPACDAGIVG